jgi:ATP-dependent DNA helicase RecQ
LTFKDVWLDSFLSCQGSISKLNSGDELIVDGGCCLNSRGQIVLKFSKQLLKQIEALKQKNYEPQKAIIRFILYWQKENSDHEVRIILPELYFERTE